MFTVLSMMAAAAAQATAGAPLSTPCPIGSYEAPDGELLALYVISAGEKAPQFRYKFLDGRTGEIGQHNALARCDKGKVSAQGKNGKWMVWRQQQLRVTHTHFRRDGISFAGELIEPEERGGKVPLAVMVSGSEHYGAIGTWPAYIIAAQGIAAFVYDKRGTGSSGGTYSQNFAVLGADAAAAMEEARRLDAGRYSRTGFVGGSQGGWVAPLGAYLSHADYVVVGFGLVLTPLEEDSEQVYDELRRKGYGEDVIAKAREVTRATDAVRESHFQSGYDQVEAVKRRYGDEPWFSQINGEFTGDILRTSEKELRRKGEVLFPEYDIDWHYDALGLMQKLNIPQLWVIAGSDREAPNGLTLKRLALLQREGKPITVMIFPHTDHGIQEFTQAPDGTRTMIKTADGFFRMEGDWIKGQWRPPYGDSIRMQGIPPSNAHR